MATENSVEIRKTFALVMTHPFKNNLEWMGNSLLAREFKRWIRCARNCIPIEPCLTSARHRKVPQDQCNELIAGTNGAVCTGGVATCFAPEWAALNYLNREISSKTLVGFRSDFVNDKKGQRTGNAGKYTENTLYLSHFIGSTVQIRPEVRFDKSWDRAGYDNGKKSNQFFMGADLIYHF